MAIIDQLLTPAVSSFQISQPFLQGYIVPSLPSKSLFRVTAGDESFRPLLTGHWRFWEQLFPSERKKARTIFCYLFAFKTGTNSCYLYYRSPPFHLHFSYFFLFLFPFLFCLHIFPDLRKLPCKCFWQFLFIQGRKKKCLLRILNWFSKFMPVCFTQQKFLKIIFPPRY